MEFPKSQNSPKLAILLATYNGERNLPFLLDSLIRQTYLNWDLFIHDDGSTDSTIKLIENALIADKRIKLLKDEISHRGAKDSFWWLLNKVDSDYYMFCDQDDIWLPYKIEESFSFLRKIENSNPNIPSCVFTDLAISDNKYNVICNSYWKSTKIKPWKLNDPDYIQVYNYVTGCTMLFNNATKAISLSIHPNAPMHDFWIAYCILKHGGQLLPLKKSTILYCQHGNNVVGAYDVNWAFFSHKFKKLPVTIKENLSQYRLMHSISGISLVKYFYIKLKYELIRLF